MIWSAKCVDDSAGFDVLDTKYGKTLKPRKIGRKVLTIKECEDYERRRRT